MKKLFFALMILSATLSCAQSTLKTTGNLTAACTNATTTCDGTAGSQLVLSVGEYSIASVTIHGTFTGVTLSFEFSDDGGVNWYPSTCTRNDASIQENSEVVADSTNRSWDCGTGAAGRFRIRMAATSSGTVIVNASQSAIQIEPAPTVSLAIPTTSFAIFSNPAAGSQATISQAAGGAGIRNVATAVCFSAGSTTAPVLTALTVNLRDGATGAGTVKATFEVIIPAATGQNVAPFCTPVNVIGSVNTAMTLEFSASLANLIEAVSLQGYTTSF
jgi:hypothetical protein